MSRIKIFAGVFAFLFAMLAAFAFTNHQASPTADRWLKYNCANGQLITTQPNSADPSTFPTVCPRSSGTLCAVKYDQSQLTETPSGSGIYIPQAGASQKEKVFCP